MHVSIKLTLSTLHHQGQPGVDVFTRLLVALGGHRYAVEVERDLRSDREIK